MTKVRQFLGASAPTIHRPRAIRSQPRSSGCVVLEMETQPIKDGPRRHPPGRIIVIAKTGEIRKRRLPGRLGGGVVDAPVLRGLDRSIYKSVVRVRDRRAAGRWDGMS